MTRMVTLLTAAAALALPASVAARDNPAAEYQKAIGDRVAGAPVRCISLSGITSSQIIDQQAIVYRVGSRMYVNQPRSGADRLDERDILLTRNIGTQLCGADIVHLIDPGSRIVRSTVVLGEFVPYSRPKTS